MGRLITYPYDNTIPYDKARTMKPHALSSIHKLENIDSDLTHNRSPTIIGTRNDQYWKDDI